jgi:hypothetical protein
MKEYGDVEVNFLTFLTLMHKWPGPVPITQHALWTLPRAYEGMEGRRNKIKNRKI